MPSLQDAVQQSLTGQPAQNAAGELESVFCFPPDCPCFAGHFPDRPMVPGIVLVMAAVAVAQSGEQTELVLRQIQRCKFLRPVAPNERLRVRIKAKDREQTTQGALDLKAELDVEGQICASLSLLLEIGQHAPDFTPLTSAKDLA